MSEEEGLNSESSHASQPAIDAILLLESAHAFPCEVMVKVIGHADDSFLQRVVEAVLDKLALSEAPPYTHRTTPNGKYISITIEPRFECAADVLLAYERVRLVRGVVMVM